MSDAAKKVQGDWYEQPKNPPPEPPPVSPLKDSPESRYKTLREHAAIELCIPNSGTDWLNDMIAKSRRYMLAGMALQGMLSNQKSKEIIFIESGERGVSSAKYFAEIACDIADAMISELENQEGSDDG